MIVYSSSARKEVEKRVKEMVIQIKNLDEEVKKIDKKYILNELCGTFKGSQFDNFFLGIGVDGSGTYPIIKIDDLVLHLFSVAVFAMKSNGREVEVVKNFPPPLPEDGRLFYGDYFSLEREEAWEKVVKVLERFYNIKSPDRLLCSFFSDLLDREVSLDEVKSKFKISKIKDEILPYLPSPSDQDKIHDEIRQLLEYSMAKKAVLSLRPDFIFIDGSMSILIPKTVIRNGVIRAPRKISNYVLRDLVKVCKKIGTIPVFVSKTQTIPSASYLISLVEREIKSTRIYVRITGLEDLRKNTGKPLHILKNRIYIPPLLSVTYLVKFSKNAPILRVDIDRNWWMKNIWSSDKDERRIKEEEFFSKLSVFTTDATFHGYLAPLGYAHGRCLITANDKKQLSAIAEKVLMELSFPLKRIDRAREKILG